MIKNKKIINLIIIYTFILLNCINVKATQSRTGNFSRAYSLCGNGATDIVAVANAQYTKTGSALGYTEDWCADFVSDCALLANQGNAIPATGGVSYLYNNILSAGGVRVSGIPQVGDIAFMDWTGGKGFGHAEIVCAVSGTTVTTIGGNSGRNTSSLYTSEVWKHTFVYNHAYYTCFVRPRYSNNTDKTPPTISDVRITDKSKSGYTVHCIVKDNNALSYVQFPTWTPWINGQDDLVWGRTEVSGQTRELNYRVNISEHQNRTNCYYVTHIYAYDTAGNSTCVSTENIFVDSTAPKISNVKITIQSGDLYTVSCKVSDDSKVEKVLFPTWTPWINGQDDLIWHKGNLSGNTATVTIRRSDHKYDYGNYVTDIYAYDDWGNVSAVRCSCTLERQPATTMAQPKKKNQTISACSFIKTYGNKAFALNAKTSGDGKLTYSSSNSKIVTVSSNGIVTIKGIGIAKITITAAGTSKYNKASKTVTVTVRPKTTALSSLKNNKHNKVVISWKRNSSVSGYKFQIATNRSFRNARTYVVKGNRVLSKNISALKGKTYYVRICTYKGSVNSSWSAYKRISVKK